MDYIAWLRQRRGRVFSSMGGQVAEREKQDLTAGEEVIRSFSTIIPKHRGQE
jgi:hypothetical protein